MKHHTSISCPVCGKEIDVTILDYPGTLETPPEFEVEIPTHACTTDEWTEGDIQEAEERAMEAFRDEADRLSDPDD